MTKQFKQRNKDLKILRRSQFKGISFRKGIIQRFSKKIESNYFGGGSFGITPSGICGKKKGIGFEMTQMLYKGSL